MSSFDEDEEFSSSEDEHEQEIDHAYDDECDDDDIGEEQFNEGEGPVEEEEGCDEESSLEEEEDAEAEEGEHDCLEVHSSLLYMTLYLQPYNLTASLVQMHCDLNECDACTR